MSKYKNPSQINGRNRAEKREAARNPQQKKLSKPLALRIIIIIIMLVMLIGFFILPLIQ